MNQYSGKFVLRIPDRLHKELSELSRAQGLSLNQVCTNLLKKGLSVSDEEPEFIVFLNGIVDQLKDFFKGKLLGVVLFGSYATGLATSESDIDLLVVLDNSVPLIRSIYRWWDSKINWKGKIDVNPHFVHLPKDRQSATGIWFEVAQDGKIIYQKKDMVDRILLELNNYAKEGNIRKYISNGHSYWVRRHDEK